jgi:hypothetical protein
MLDNAHRYKTNAPHFRPRGENTCITSATALRHGITLTSCVSTPSSIAYDSKVANPFIDYPILKIKQKKKREAEEQESDDDDDDGEEAHADSDEVRE